MCIIKRYAINEIKCEEEEKKKNILSEEREYLF